MDFREYQQKPLSEKVADEIVKYIVDNGLQPGDKLPSEPKLIEWLQVGRGSVREAVKSLISRNILVIRRGDGTYVAENFGIANDPLGLEFIRDKHKLSADILQLRLLIEPEIAAMAAQNATDADIAELEILCADVEKMIFEHKLHVTSDQKFHTKIAQCSGNSVVINLFPLIHYSIELLVDLTHRRLTDQTIITHREILHAIRNHDMLRARDAMILHLMYNKRMLEPENE